ncbi:hypothetical protein QD357_05840 [Rhizobium sp. BR 317]|uniref:hypothetical protein n=1 Tax=Rhizobium sp. BR 317 TaxID=3040015 RepID=UPI0039BEFC4F
MMNPQKVFDPEEAAKYISNGGLSKLPLEQLHWFMTVTRSMADLAEAEIKRRGVHPLLPR